MPDEQHIEEWHPIPEYEQLYSVSDCGRVRRDAPGQGAVVGRILRSAISENGYPVVVLCDPSGHKTRYVHDLVAAAFLGVKPNKLDVNHKNGVRADNRLSNIEYCTRAENEAHARAVLGKDLRGERHGMSKLTEAQVRTILAERHRPVTELARTFGVSHSAISDILRGKRWSHVK